MQDTRDMPSNHYSPQWNGASTHNTNANRSLVREYDISKYNMIPRQWTDGYRGVNDVNGFLQSRMMASDAANARFKAFQDAPVSARSYGNYGVNM
jgi:hypothetical protein